MKKALISSFLIGTLIISTSIICTASTYDFPNMTSEELNEVKDIIDDELHINHTPNKNEISEVEKISQKTIMT